VHKRVDSAPRIYSTNWVSFGQVCNILSFIQILCFIINVKFEMIFVLIPLYIVIYGINYFFLLTDKKYEKLLEIYKYEKHKRIKGWGVFLYLIGSLVIWLACIFLLKNTYSNYNFDLNVIEHLI
jgi:hypothetical protein